MPRYLVLERSYLPAPDGSSRIYEAGEEVDYNDFPSANLKPLDAEGEAKVAEQVENLRRQRAELKAQLSESAVGDPAAFAAELKKALAEGMAEQSKQIADQVATGIAQAFAQMFPNGFNKPPVQPTAADKADPAGP